MHKALVSLSCMLLALTACAGPQAQDTPQIIKLYASSAVYPWLDAVYKCAPSSGAVVVLSTRDSADIGLNFGAPDGLSSAAFRIGRDDLLVVVQPQTGVGPLTTDQVRMLFSGQITQWAGVGGANLPVEVWSYSPSEDIQKVFDEQVMQGEPIVSLARLAVSAQAMSDSVGANPGSIGILPRRWKAGNTEVVFTLPALPVLAVTSSPPHGAVQNLIGCLQSSDQQ